MFLVPQALEVTRTSAVKNTLTRHLISLVGLPLGHTNLIFCFTSTAGQFPFINVNQLVGVATSRDACDITSITSWRMSTLFYIRVYMIIMATSITNQAWVSAEVKRGSVTLVAPTIVAAKEEDSFASLLEKLGSGDLHTQLQIETVQKVSISGSGPTVHVVPLSAPVAVVSQTLLCLCQNTITCNLFLTLSAWLVCTSINCNIPEPIRIH